MIDMSSDSKKRSHFCSVKVVCMSCVNDYVSVQLMRFSAKGSMDDSFYWNCGYGIRGMCYAYFLIYSFDHIFACVDVFSPGPLTMCA